MLLDSDVMVDVVRGHAPAVAWLASGRTTPLRLAGFAAMELLQGCRNLADQRRVEKRLQSFPLCWPTLADCQQGYQDFAAYRLSHGLGLIDALIGATAVGSGETLATFNVKHYAVIVGLTTVQPY
jgi:predicted nucleic acid-binding protein